MDYASLFSGLDEATVSDQLPKFTDGDFEFQVNDCKGVDGQNGFSFVIECTLLSSTNEEFPAGGRGSITINGLRSDNKTKKQIAQGNLKGFLAAAFGIDSESQQQWIGLAGMVLEKKILNGAILRTTAQTCETNPKDKSVQRFKFIKHSYRPSASNPRTLAAIVAELQGGGRAG